MDERRDLHGDQHARRAFQGDRADVRRREPVYGYLLGDEAGCGDHSCVQFSG